MWAYYQQISNCCRPVLTYWLTDKSHQRLTHCWSYTAFRNTLNFVIYGPTSAELSKCHSRWNYVAEFVDFNERQLSVGVAVNEICHRAQFAGEHQMRWGAQWAVVSDVSDSVQQQQQQHYSDLGCIGFAATSPRLLHIALTNAWCCRDWHFVWSVELNGRVQISMNESKTLYLAMHFELRLSFYELSFPVGDLDPHPVSK